MSGGNSIFLQFPPAPSEGKITQFEQHGQLKYQTSESKQKNYPEVTISCENTRNAAQRENAKSAFLPHDETVWKRALHAWYEMGCTGVFEEIVNSQSEVPDWAGSLAKKTLTVLRLGNSLHGTLFPHLSVSIINTMQKLSKSPVRAFSWHPHTLKFAYALQDDSIKVHTSKSELVPILKHKLQKYVADLAWQPNSASVLAVACKSCILIWHVEPTSLATRPSTSSVQVLQQNNHAPVTCLSWDPSGKILLSSSPVDTAIMAWDVPMETCIPLRRVGGGGVSLLKWSPDGAKVFSSTPSHLFRVWETIRWTCEVWTKCTSRCKAACWSPKGDVLLFATENEPIIYSLSFATTTYDNKAVIGGSQSAVAVVDLSEVDTQTEDGSIVKVGGLVQNLVWDSTGERLAVLLHDSKGDMCRYVALFRTKTSPVLDITPCGLVYGPMGNIPHTISFQPNYDKGALLTVVWSNGELQYIPLYFIARNDVNLDYHQQVNPTTNGQILSPIRM
ncbi:hypothetical protein FSP39_002817 [Pinctada imbricata]|uniref:Aladin seven-bladed propeller domain-containing protein n=1 Tax=Pinctada imbricata TaxID=66713 RepID=A0AA88YT90_PINIB|nr:hypothetical protein FSP39_002817 [Pinctada imbricata]